MGAASIARWCVRIAALSLLLLLARFHIRETLAASIQYDDAFIASVAKNTARGYGYSTSYHEIDPFDPEVSTGPSIIFPTALLIRVVGNRYWVPNLTITAAIWTALLLLIAQVHRRLPKTQAYVWTGLVAAGLLIFTTGEFGLLGEVPAVCLIGSCFIWLSDPGEDDRVKGMLAGLALGLAIQAKLIALFVVPAAALFQAAAALGRGRSSRLHLRWTRLAWCLAGLAMPLAAWQAYQVIGAGSLAGWADVQLRELGFLAGPRSLSGVGQVRLAASAIGVVKVNVARNAVALSMYAGGWWRLLPALCGLGIAAVMLFRSPRASLQTRRLACLLSSAVLVHLSWWLAISPTGWYRHLLPGIMYGLLLTAVLVSEATRLSFRFGAIVTASCAVTAALVLPFWAVRGSESSNVFQWTFKPDGRLRSLLTTRARLIELQKDPSVVLVGCGWWVPRDLEYILPGVNNFSDCYRLQPSQIAERRVVLVRNEYFNQDNNQVLARYREACDRQVLYRQDPFVVSQCGGLPSKMSAD